MKENFLTDYGQRGLHAARTMSETICESYVVIPETVGFFGLPPGSETPKAALRLEEDLSGESSKLMTVFDASEFLALTRRTIHKLVREGRLGCVQVTAKERRFTREQLDAYVEGKTIMPKVVDRTPVNPLPSPKKGGERRNQRVTNAVSDAGLLKKEIRSLCQ